MDTHAMFLDNSDTHAMLSTLWALQIKNQWHAVVIYSLDQQSGGLSCMPTATTPAV
jgi:hypothetical protein